MRRAPLSTRLDAALTSLLVLRALLKTHATALRFIGTRLEERGPMDGTSRKAELSDWPLGAQERPFRKQPHAK